MKLGVLLSVGLALGMMGTAQANDFEEELMAYLNGADWVQDPAVVSAIEAQNAEYADISQDKIDAMDQQWRGEKEAGGGPMIDKVLNNTLSKFLKSTKEESGGLIAEVFVMDQNGLNVGQSDPTSDYWQGDEGKFQKSYGSGPDGVLIDEVEFDDSSESYISQVSRTIVGADGKPIGAVTIGVNVENL